MKKYLLMIAVVAVAVVVSLTACSEHKSEMQKAQEAAMETYETESTMDPVEAKLNAPKQDPVPIVAIYKPGENGKLEMDFVNVSEVDGTVLLDELTYAGVLPSGMVLSLDEDDVAKTCELGIEGIDGLTDAQKECVEETFIQNLGLKKFTFYLNEELVTEYEKEEDVSAVGPGM